MSEISQFKTHFLVECLASLKQLTKKLKINGVVTITRQLIHFRPWRKVAFRLLKSSQPKKIVAYQDSTLPTHCPNNILKRLKSDGLAILGQLPSDLVRNIRNKTDKLPLNEYKFVHQVSDEIRQLSKDPALLLLLQNYFKRARTN
ncbi:hypothetical protein [Alteromonas sp. ASW11-130]|uniref:hypothetical protein n=1 Tax=Alteromonas sp. ASW11-130 TaxID=3015775 RepID=UPI00224245BF|nr:hypothetical protein [Alteromonas sp. ASW11-130]MCW8092199.1 hypothetical protein [Alteromonas sp. ASW11-130]